MKKQQSNTAAITLVSLGLSALVSQGAVIFGASQNGDFYDGDSPVHNGNRFNAGTRLANQGGSHFVGTWNLTQSSFGGIDQVRSSGDRGLLANSGVTTTAIAYATAGSNGGTQSVNSGSQNSGDDTLPSGAFATNITIGETVAYSFEVIDNTEGGSFTYTVGLLLNGETDLGNLFTLATGTYTGVTGSTASAQYTTISGTSAVLPAAVTSFNVVAIANNGNGGNDQVGIDDIVLNATVVPEPSTGLLSLAALGFFIRRKR